VTQTSDSKHECEGESSADNASVHDEQEVGGDRLRQNQQSKEPDKLSDY
jgi:hypothetical protein